MRIAQKLSSLECFVSCTHVVSRSGDILYSHRDTPKGIIITIGFTMVSRNSLYQGLVIHCSASGAKESLQQGKRITQGLCIIRELRLDDPHIVLDECRRIC